MISGGAGFIGSHLVDLLIRRGWQVVALDNFITGSRDNLGPAMRSKALELRDLDVTTPFSIDGRVELVLHLASLASPEAYEAHPIETLQVGTVGTTRMLELARAKGACFLFTSTSEVYGDPLVHPQPESYWGNVNPIGPRSCYDESKRCGEALVMAYHRVHDVDTRIVRVFNTYGPRMSAGDGRAIPAFAMAALRGAPVTIHGDGLQTRSFCYVDDLVDGILAVVDRGDHLPYNLGSTDEITMRDLARSIVDLAGSSSPVAYTGARPEDPRKRRPEIARARSDIGWAPSTGLEEGLRRTLEHFRRVADGRATGPGGRQIQP